MLNIVPPLSEGACGINTGTGHNVILKLCITLILKTANKTVQYYLIELDSSFFIHVPTLTRHDTEL